jgi:hypothetical protein
MPLRRIKNMKRATEFRRRFSALASLARISLALALVSVFIAEAGQKIHLAPKFIPGQTLRYRIQARTSTKGTTTTPIANPEGGSEENLASLMVVRLDVLNAAPAASDAQGAARIRATYEESQATEESDAVNPGAPAPGEQYQRMEGRSIEFTIGPGGQLADFQGLDKIFPNASDAEPMLSWARGLSSSAGFPKHGIEIGQKWTSERDLEGLPLTGLQWKTEATYLRDEPCSSSAASGAGETRAETNPAAPATNSEQREICAIILTQFEIQRHASARSDATPDDYRKNGLRTSGKWSGSGESLDYISLASGLLVSSTQSSTQDVDYQIISTKNAGSTIHRTSHVTTKTEITLLPAPLAPKS